ncbi:MAG: hypothetical protein RL293_531, partial [Bacteroidota bacterium]
RLDQFSFRLVLSKPDKMENHVPSENSIPGS